METKVFKLKRSRYTAELATEISARVSRGYRRIVTVTATLKVGDGDNKATVDVGEMKLETIMDAQEYVLKNILITLLDKDSNTKGFEDLLDLPSSDVDPLFNYVDLLINQGTLSTEEKKDGLVAASSSKKVSAV